MLALLAFGSLILSLERRRLLRVLQLRTVGRVVLLLLGTASLIGCGSGWRTKAWSMNITATSGQLSRSVTALLISQCSDGQAACPIEH